MPLALNATIIYLFNVFLSFVYFIFKARYSIWMFQVVRIGKTVKSLIPKFIYLFNALQVVPCNGTFWLDDVKFLGF